MSETEMEIAYRFCPKCSGHGYHIVSVSTETGTLKDTQTCEVCHGTGRIPAGVIPQDVERTK